MGAARALTLRPSEIDFVDELYAAAVEPGRLSGALGLFAGVLGADTAYLLVKDFSASGSRTRVFERSTGRGDPPLDGPLVDAVTAEILPGHERVLVGDLAKTSTGRVGKPSLPQPCPRLEYLAATVKGGPWVSFSLVALREHGTFTDADRQAASDLLPDIRRALSLRQLAGKTGPFALKLRDGDLIAVLVVRNRAVEHANSAARALLDMSTVIANPDGELRFCDRRAQATFDAIAKCAGNVGGRRRATSLVVRGTDGGAWIAQFADVDAEPDPTLAVRPSVPATSVVLTPFEAASRSRAAMLNGFANLTPTERQILAAFVDGRGISAIAAQTERSVETIRWHVRNLFRKVGVSTQADLARVGALLLPI